MSRRLVLARTLSLLSVLAGGAVLSAQSGAQPTAHADRLLVKLHEESGAVLEDGRLGSRAGVDLGSVARLFAAAKHVERCVPLPLELLDRWHREADERLPAGCTRPGHLGLWFRLWFDAPDRATRMLGELAADPWVQHAERERIPLLASPPITGSGDDLPPETPDLTSLQRYGQPAPVGLGFDAAHRIAGARGQQARIYHAENAWWDDHEDLGSLGPTSYVVAPFPTAVRQQLNHGTAFVGVSVAQRNGFGMDGVVDQADMRLVSWLTTGNIATAIALATADARPGDVIGLVAIYNLAMVKIEDYVPCEYAALDFDAILTATTQGVIVVEAAGNGDNDLDDPRFALRFDRANRDSGAILVGATAGSQLVRAPFSNYGSRIDVNGWGDEVATLAYGTWLWLAGDDRQSYTERYAGTSSASALITAALGQLSSVVRVQLGRPLMPLEVRDLLHDHGTPIPGQIGKRPDVAAVLTALGLPDGLDVDRHALDVGSAATVSLSGPAGGVSAVAAAFDLAGVDLGFDRPLVLDPASLVSLGAFVLTDGTASLPIQVPNVAELSGTSVFLQALEVAPGSGALSLSSAAELWVR